MNATVKDKINSFVFDMLSFFMNNYFEIVYFLTLVITYLIIAKSYITWLSEE